MLQSMGSQSQTWLSNWTTNPLLGSYPEISLLCWIYFEHGGNYLQGNSGAQEANRLSSLEDLQTFGRPFPSHASGALCYKEARSCWELPTITQQVGCGIHVELWSSFFLLNPHPAWVSVLPWDFMFLFCTACLCSRKDLFFFIISPHVRGWEPGCVCQMHCVALTPAVPCLMIWYLGERETVRRKICSVPWTLGFGHFSWRQSLAASFLILTSLFSGQEINLYTKTQGFVSRCLRGSFGPQWSFLGEFVISLGIGLNASGLRFSFEVYFMFCCGFQISHGLDLGK